MIYRYSQPYICQWCKGKRSQGDHRKCSNELQKAKAKKPRNPSKKNLERYYLDFVKPRIIDGQ